VLYLHMPFPKLLGGVRLVVSLALEHEVEHRLPWSRCMFEPGYQEM
jgi:hypothetical protein